MQQSQQQQQQQQKPLSFDYLYEFSETRKVLEEFFTCQTSNDKILEKLSDFNESDVGGSYDNIDQDEINHHHLNSGNSYENNTGGGGGGGISYIGQRLAKFPTMNDDYQNNHPPPSQRQSGNVHHNQQQQQQMQSQHNMRHDDIYEHQDIELFLDSGSRSSGELADTEVEHNMDGHTRNFTLSPETTDYDSNCGDLDSELSLRYTGLGGEFGKLNTTTAPSPISYLNSNNGNSNKCCKYVRVVSVVQSCQDFMFSRCDCLFSFTLPLLITFHSTPLSNNPLEAQDFYDARQP